MSRAVDGVTIFAIVGLLVLRYVVLPLLLLGGLLWLGHLVIEGLAHL